MELSQKLKNRRKEIKLTQEEVAEKIHVSRQTISNWETGRTLPDINSLVMISNVYEISLDKLIKGDEQIIKRLSEDTKETDMWFIFSLLISNIFSSFIANQAKNLPLKLTVLLLLVQTISMGYIGMNGFNFLQKREASYKKEENIKTSKYTVTLYDIVYATTIVCGVVVIFYTLLSIE
ncbi:helix-turn-helix domain-containing protein [Vagococcus elongatus]|uniref:HTH cro/C1-type domain-containing protein n=1 Tax=Vagococcus elongatus TaxID=180344 RepID=A0A430AUZ6_9ENTE|nr:helix-turn-helix transcriptional regulator [Vagococcus elongatus]RSU11869.1 hypothetical protein CBF29_07055 [Vagococcus elongatus]